MLMEQPMSGSPRPEDIQAAMALVDEHPLLKNDPITRNAIEKGIGANGKPVNLDKFVETRGAFLELEEARRKLKEIGDEDPDILDAIVVSSVRPDLEKYIN